MGTIPAKGAPGGFEISSFVCLCVNFFDVPFNFCVLISKFVNSNS